MTKSKNLENKNTVSGNRTETSMTNCGKNQNSEKNRTTNSSKNMKSESMEENDKY